MTILFRHLMLVLFPVPKVPKRNLAVHYIAQAKLEKNTRRLFAKECLFMATNIVVQTSLINNK